MIRKRKSRVCGEYPKTLYRFFDHLNFAKDFINHGKMRVGLLSGYMSIECGERRDITEGKAHYRTPGMVTSALVSQDPTQPTTWVKEAGIRDHHAENLNAIFLLCCSLSLDKLEKKKDRFGPYVVKLHSPVSLAIDLDYALNGAEGTGGTLINGARVEYNKGEILLDSTDRKERTDLAYTQKPPSFSEDEEYRYCIMDLSHHGLPEDNSEKFRYLDIGHELEYAELIEI